MKIFIQKTLFYLFLLGRIGGYGCEVCAQMPDTLKRDSLISVLKDYDLRKKELKQYSIVTADTQKAILLWEIFFVDDNYKNLDAQKSRIAELKKISEFLNYTKGIANSIFGEAAIQATNQEYKKASELHRKALEIREKINDTVGIAWSYFNIAACYQWQNRNKEATPWYYKGIKVGERLKDSSLLGIIYCGLSGIHYDLNDIKGAISNAEKSVIYSHTLKGDYNHALNLMFLCSYYAEVNETTKSDSVLHIAYEISTALKSHYHLAYYYSTYSELCAKKGNYGEAILNLIKSNAHEDSMQLTWNKSWNYCNIAEYILESDKKQLAIAGIPESKQNDEVIRYARLSLDLSLPSNSMDVTARNYRFMSAAYEAKGNMAEAFKYFKMSTTIKDSLYNDENTKTIQGLKMQYETEKQQQQIASLTKDKQLQQKEISSKKSQRNALMGGSILMLLLAGVAYNRFRVKQKANSEIEKTLNHLHNAQEQLVQQGKLAALGKMTADVASKIQHPLSDVKKISRHCDEMIMEYENANTDEERNSLLEKLKSNLIEINSNGKQADAIVKDVLMQSRL